MKLIDKDAVLAEIEKLLDKGKYHDDYDCVFRDGNNAALYALKGRIDTLEVKEVDLDGERRKYLTEYFNVYEDGILQSKRSNLPLDTYDVIKIAKHFFELGLKVQKGE